MSAPKAHFASRRSDLLVIERPAEPIWDQGRRVGVKAGKLHQFREHQYTAEGQAAIDFLRARMKAPDGPEIWELEGATDVPSVVELLAEIATADIARVREIFAAEHAGPQRTQVLQTCQAVFDKAGAATKGPGAQRTKPKHEHELVG